MRNQELLNVLRALEKELLRPDVRADSDRLGGLLHAEFEEFARSGRRYDRAAVLREFSNGRVAEPVVAENFDLAQLSDTVALLTYESRHADGARPSLRSSIWVWTPAGWRLRFHQGTPADALRHHA